MRTPLPEIIHVRADRELHDAIHQAARRERESVSNYVRRMLRQIVVRQAESDAGSRAGA